MKIVAFHYLHARADCDGFLDRGSSHLKLCGVPHTRPSKSAPYAAYASRPFGHVSVAAHIVFIGGVPRLTEDVGCSCRFPPGTARKRIDAPAPHWGWGV